MDGASCADTGAPPELQEVAETGERKRSEVAAAARAAGLSVDEGAPGAQVLRFADGLNSDELKLMELPHDVLGALLDGDRWVRRPNQQIITPA